MEELLIEKKFTDMMLNAYVYLAQFPKSEKFGLATDMKRSMDLILHKIIEAKKKYYKKTTLQELDVELDILRHLIRVAQDKDYYGPNVAPPLSFKKYEYWSGLLAEIGRIIGGYMKYVN